MKKSPYFYRLPFRIIFCKNIAAQVYDIGPWERDDFVHPREKGRFAQYPDGKIEYK